MTGIKRWHGSGASAAVAILCCVSTLGLHAEPSSQDETVYQRYLDFGSLVEGESVELNWLPDGSSFWYVQADPNDRQILRLDPASNAVTPMFDVARLRAVLRESLGHEPVGKGVP